MVAAALARALHSAACPPGRGGTGSSASRTRDGRAADRAPLDVRVGQCRCERGKCVRSGQHRQGAGWRIMLKAHTFTAKISHVT